MTLTELQALPPDALNERAAKCMGWELDDDGKYTAEFRDLVGFKVEYWSADTHWNPSDNLIQAAELEAEIARRGGNGVALKRAYIEALVALTRKGKGYRWEIAVGGPYHRTVAAVHVLQGEAQ